MTDNPTMRKAREAAFKAIQNRRPVPGFLDLRNDEQRLNDGIDAALAVLMDEKCPTCKGKSYIVAGPLEDLRSRHECPDCIDGKNPDRLYTQEDLERELREPGTLTGEICKRIRAEVVAEIVQDLGDQLNAYEASLQPDEEPVYEKGIEFAINYIQRKEKEQ